jgi:Cthe_2314-like HEPN
MSHDLSEEDAKQLIESRVKFKLYAAEQHLESLKILEQNGSSMQSFKERVKGGEIESFLYHIVGARDSLLIKINDKLALKLNEKEVYVNTIENMLTQLNEQHLLTALRSLNNNSCFQIVLNLRNESTHRKLINVLFSIGSEKAKVFFVTDPDKELEVIHFLRLSEILFNTSIQMSLIKIHFAGLLLSYR